MLTGAFLHIQHRTVARKFNIVFVCFFYGNMVLLFSLDSKTVNLLVFRAGYMKHAFFFKIGKPTLKHRFIRGKNLNFSSA